jgi:hypothetical protein
LRRLRYDFRFSGTVNLFFTVALIDERDENLVSDISDHCRVGGSAFYRFFLFDLPGECRIASIYSFVTITSGASSITWRRTVVFDRQEMGPFRILRHIEG